MTYKLNLFHKQDCAVLKGSITLRQSAASISWQLYLRLNVESHSKRLSSSLPPAPNSLRENEIGIGTQVGTIVGADPSGSQILGVIFLLEWCLQGWSSVFLGGHIDSMVLGEPSKSAFSQGWFSSPPPVQCHEPLPINLQALCLLDQVPWIYLSLPLYNHKGFNLGHTWMV